MSFDAIADHLCDAALAHGGRCTWLGMTQDADDDSDQVDFAWGTVGPDLYGGGAGIALFLGEAARRTGTPRWRDTALAGMALSLERLDAVPPAGRIGFYTGHVGIAHAAAAIGMEDEAAALLDRVAGAADQSVTVDLLSGGTGAIVPLLALAQRLGRPPLRDLALRLGTRTVAAAAREDGGWSWPVATGAIEAARPLTGMAHGAAGIGWALLELGAATGAGEMIEAARGAFGYEDRWFRPAEENWPDFREEEGNDAPACVAWCHGAPGIGLARLRAVELGYGEYRPSAEAAVRTTRAAVAERDGWIDGDWSLCHGRAGLAETLRYASRVLGDGDADALVREAAADAAARFGDDPERWPCGVRRGSNPSLMLGLAGIGHFYLSLADPTLPSLLLPGP